MHTVQIYFVLLYYHRGICSVGAVDFRQQEASHPNPLSTDTTKGLKVIKPHFNLVAAEYFIFFSCLAVEEIALTEQFVYKTGCQYQ